MKRTIKITAKSVKELKPEAKDIDYHDMELNGFHVRVQKSGRKTYRMLYRERKGRGAKRRVETLGTTGKLSSDAARKLAQDIAYKVGRGSSPAAEREAEKQKARVGEVWPLFIASLESLGRAKNTIRDYQHQYDRRIRDAFQDRPVGEVSRAEIIRWHDAGHEKTRSANLALSILSSFFSYCIDRGYREGDNPCQRVKKFPEKKREAAFTPDELGRFTQALNDYGDHALNVAFMMMITTGARNSEVRLAEWSHLELDDKQPRWRVPAENIKQRKDHFYELTPEVAQLIRDYRNAPVVSTRWLFPGKSPDKPRSEFLHAFYRIERLAGIEHQEGRGLHGFRHTYITELAQGGASVTELMTITGHKSVQAAMGYVNRVRDERVTERALAVARRLQSQH